MKPFVTLLIVFATLSATSQNTFLTSYPYWERAEAAFTIEQPDGYVLLGSGNLELSDQQAVMFLLKIDFTGDTIWRKEIALNEYATSITGYAVDGDGNTYVVLMQQGGNNIFKFDSNWNLTYNGDFGLQSPYKIKVLNDNNLLVLTWHSGDYIPHKINHETFAEIWTGDTLSSGYDSYIGTIVEKANGDLAIVRTNLGLEPGAIGSTVYYISSSGVTISQHTFDQFILGTTRFDGDNLFSLAYYDHSGGFNALVRFQPDGTIISNIDISLANYSFREFVNDGNKLVMMGNYLGAAPDYYNVAIGCVMDNQIEWAYNYSQLQSADGYYYPYEIIKTSDNGYLITGTLDPPNSLLPFLLKTDNSGMIIPVGYPEKSAQVNYTLYPNPANDYIILTSKKTPAEGSVIELYNSSGSLISKYVMAMKKNLLDISKLNTGNYFIKIITSDEITLLKLVKR